MRGFGAPGAPTGTRRFVVLALGMVLGFAPSGAAGQGAGSSASTLLRVAPGPRPLALANAFVALPGPLALEYNPAAVRAGAVTASYQQLPLDANAGAAGVTFPAGPTSLGVSLRFVNYGSIDVVEPVDGGPVGRPTGDMAMGGELSALVGGAIELGPARLGLAGRWLQLDIAGVGDGALVADAGVLLEPAAGLTLGASVQGVGTELEAGRSAPVLRTVRVGAAVERWYGERVKAILTVEGRRREARTGGGAGLEVRAGSETVEGVARIGYETRPDPGDAFSPVVFGGGVRLNALTVEFAYRALGPLGSTRQVGLRYEF